MAAADLILVAQPVIQMALTEVVVRHMGIVVQRLISMSLILLWINDMLTAWSCLISNGCQNGCTTSSTSTSLAPRASGTQEPVIGAPSTVPVTGADTTDGTCGAANGDTVCGNWPQGGCCSLYGVSLSFARSRESHI